jgi:hypothetical protein
MTLKNVNLKPLPLPDSKPERLRMLADFIDGEDMGSRPAPGFRMSTFGQSVMVSDDDPVTVSVGDEHVTTFVPPCGTVCCGAGMTLFIWEPLAYVRYLNEFYDPSHNFGSTDPVKRARNILGLSKRVAENLFVPEIAHEEIERHHFAAMCRWLADQPDLLDHTEGQHHISVHGIMARQWSVVVNSIAGEGNDVLPAARS